MDVDNLNVFSLFSHYFSLQGILQGSLQGIVSRKKNINTWNPVRLTSFIFFMYVDIYYYIGRIQMNFRIGLCGWISDCLMDNSCEVGFTSSMRLMKGFYMTRTIKNCYLLTLKKSQRFWTMVKEMKCPNVIQKKKKKLKFNVKKIFP